MNIWSLVALFLLVTGAALAVWFRKRRKPRVRNSLKRPPVTPAPFEIRSFGDADGEPLSDNAEVVEAVAAYAAYCETYRRLLAGEAATDIPEYPRFVADGQAEASCPALESFIRTAFHSDVLYGYLALQFEKNLRNSLQNGMASPWTASPLGEAALIAFKRTSEERYVELYRHFFDRLMMLRDTALGYHDDYHDKVMNAWGSYNLGRNAGMPGRWVAHITHFSVMMLPATGFAREILSRADLTAHHAWARSVVDYFEVAYRQFDGEYRDVEGVSEKWYWRPLLDKYEATNHVHVQGQALLNIHAIMGDAQYAERIRSFLRIFEDGVTLHDDGLASWNYSPYFQVANEKNGHMTRQVSEYSWKGEVTVAFLYEAKRDGFEIRPDVLEGVTSSIRDHILKDADCKLHVHPKGSRPIGRRDRKKTGSIESGISGYHIAAAEDPGIAQQVVDVVVARPTLFPGGWLSQPRLARSYARFLPADR